LNIGTAGELRVPSLGMREPCRIVGVQEQGERASLSFDTPVALPSAPTRSRLVA